MYNCHCDECEGITLHVSVIEITKMNETVEIIECSECEKRYYHKN